MFADLVKFREEKFARKHTIELYTPDKTYHLKAFSAYAKTADTSIPITFKNQEEKNAYITKLKNRNGVSSIIQNNLFFDCMDIGSVVMSFVTTCRKCINRFIFLRNIFYD